MAGRIIENPLFKEKSSDSVRKGYYSSMLADDQHRGLIEEPRQHFQKLLTKPWSFRFLKGLHWLLLLPITIFCAACAGDYNFALGWSSCWNNAFSRSFLWLLQISDGPSLWQLLVVALLMATGSLVAQRWKGKTQLASIALADFCLGWAFLFAQSLVLLNYALRSYTEYSWYYPKLRNSSISLAELTEWGKKEEFLNHLRSYIRSNRGKEYVDFRLWTTTARPSTTISPGDLEQMEQRKLFIMVRLVLDPSITILALVAVLLQADLLLSISRAIKRSRVWVSNYRLERPNCTEQEAKYAKFWPLGLIKLALVVISMAFLFTVPLRDRFFLGNSSGIFVTWALICLANWICYVQKVRFRGKTSTKTQAEETEELANFRRKDCFFNFLSFLLIAFIRFLVVNRLTLTPVLLDETHEFVNWTILGLFFIAFLYTFSLQTDILNLEKIGTALRMPQISANLQLFGKKKDGEEMMRKKEFEEVIVPIEEESVTNMKNPIQQNAAHHKQTEV